MIETNQALGQLQLWWNALPPVRRNNDLPAWGTITGALVVLERLKAAYSLCIDDHLAANSMQIAGLSRPKVARILCAFSASRSLPAEGGRTSMGSISHVSALLAALAHLRLEALEPVAREAVLTELQRWLVEAKMPEYPEPGRIRFRFQPELTTWANLHALLEAARAAGKEGQVAQYLVGAKLTLRFPDLEIRNDSYSTSDVQSGHPGDFLVWDFVYHVTVAPNAGHYARCEANLRDGYRVYLIVPERILLGTRQNLSETLARRMRVLALEDFVAQNLDELTVDAREGAAGGFRRLLTTYNARVDAVETDKSLLIELPHNLVGLQEGHA